MAFNWMKIRSLYRDMDIAQHFFFSEFWDFFPKKATEMNERRNEGGYLDVPDRKNDAVEDFIDRVPT